MKYKKGFSNKVGKRLTQKAIRSTYDIYPWKPKKISKRGKK